MQFQLYDSLVHSYCRLCCLRLLISIAHCDSNGIRFGRLDKCGPRWFQAKLNQPNVNLSLLYLGKYWRHKSDPRRSFDVRRLPSWRRQLDRNPAHSNFDFNKSFRRKRRQLRDSGKRNRFRLANYWSESLQLKNKLSALLKGDCPVIRYFQLLD